MDKLSSLSSQLKTLKKEVARDVEAEHRENDEQKLKGLLAATCAVVDQAGGDAATEEAADALLNKMVSFAYSKAFEADFFQSFTPNVLVEDPTSKGLASMGARAIAMFQDMKILFGSSRLGEMPELNRDVYYSTDRPNVHTSLIARFKKGVPRSVVTDTTPNALAVFQARLSASSTRVCMPVQLSLPLNSPCMGLLQCGGYKDRDPVLSVFHCDVDSTHGFCKEVNIESGLVDIASQMVMDADRKLVYVADGHRIKSYQYGDESEKLTPKHTLQTKNLGPIALIENGSRIVCAGKAGIDVWAVDSLPTHGPEGTTPIGTGKVSAEDSWRGESSVIETSTGTKADSVIACSIETRVWANFQDTQNVLMSPVESYSCFSVDLQAGCKITSRHLGHGGYVNGFSTSPDDVNSFLTSCNDGVVRLFDVRQTLPRLSIDAGAGNEHMDSALYVHVDGLPVIFTGGSKSETIKVWDPRANAIIYELATGNNSVTSMAWDAPRNTLFAATECTYVDRYGCHHEYRRAKIPKQYRSYEASGNQDTQQQRMDIDGGEEEGLDDEDDEDDEDDDYDDYGRRWPKQAYHLETDFGYAFDSGEHRLFRYKFGLDAEPKALPEYGQA